MSGCKHVADISDASRYVKIGKTALIRFVVLLLLARPTTAQESFIHHLAQKTGSFHEVCGNAIGFLTVSVILAAFGYAFGSMITGTTLGLADATPWEFGYSRNRPTSTLLPRLLKSRSKPNNTLNRNAKNRVGQAIDSQNTRQNSH
ncbi:hypothetical protein [Planctomycetes bacterium CA13]